MNEQVFISHSSNDQAWAGMIAQALEENGIRCWYDVHSIGPGDDYDEEIFRAIKRCPIFLLVLTENAVKQPSSSRSWALRSGSIRRSSP